MDNKLGLVYADPITKTNSALMRTIGALFFTYQQSSDKGQYLTASSPSQIASRFLG